MMRRWTSMLSLLPAVRATRATTGRARTCCSTSSWSRCSCWATSRRGRDRGRSWPLAAGGVVAMVASLGAAGTVDIGGEPVPPEPFAGPTERGRAPAVRAVDHVPAVRAVLAAGGTRCGARTANGNPTTRDTMKRWTSVLRRVRRRTAIFIVGLVLQRRDRAADPDPARARRARPGRGPARGRARARRRWPTWLQTLRDGIRATAAGAPFMFYGTDWLAFGHFAIAVAFVGALRDPLRNRWLFQYGMWICAAVPVWALVCGPVRGFRSGGASWTRRSVSWASFRCGCAIAGFARSNQGADNGGANHTVRRSRTSSCRCGTSRP